MSFAYKNRGFVFGQVIPARSKKKRKRNDYLLLSSFKKYRKLQRPKYVVYQGEAAISKYKGKKCYTKNIIDSNFFTTYKQLKRKEYLIGSNQIIFLNPPGMLLPHKFIFYLSKGTDCIKAYRYIRPNFTESVKLDDDELQKEFTKLHKKVMKRYKKIFKKKGIFKDNGEGKQYAWAVLKKDDGSIRHFKVEFPYQKGKRNRKKCDSAETKHCEDFLINQIKKVVKKNTKFKYTELFIYSVNTPCLGRKGQNPCMINLTNMSIYLGINYNIKTYIGFSKYYVCGDLKKQLPYQSFCDYDIPSHIKEHLKIPTNDKGVKYNDSEKQELRDIYLNIANNFKFCINGGATLTAKHYK